jgi:hypothetical protein
LCVCNNITQVPVPNMQSKHVNGQSKAQSPKTP